MNEMDQEALKKIRALETRNRELESQNGDLRRQLWRMLADREYLDPWLSSTPPSWDAQASR